MVDLGRKPEPYITLAPFVMMSSRLIFFTTGLLLLVDPAHAQTHCLTTEKTYFSCKIKNSEKVLSLCGDALDEKDYAKPNGWLQYRFGRLGKTELVFPTQKIDSLNRFRGTNQNSSGGLPSSWFRQVHFVIGRVDYSIEKSEWTTEDSEDKNYYGVRVSVPKGVSAKTVELKCESYPASTQFELLTLVLPEDK